jgi:hypothetical protein
MKNNKSKLLLLAIPAILSLQPANAMDNNSGSVNIVAEKMPASAVFIYEGTLNNPSLTYPIRTTFYRDKTGNINGEYIFNDKGKEIYGTFSEPRFENGHNIFTWRDVYGKGTLKLKFSNDLSSFQGLWAAENDKPSDPGFNWNGKQTRGY